MSSLSQEKLNSIALIAYGLAFEQNKKKQSAESTNNYLKKQIEVGDVVHKIKTKTISKYYQREGKVIQVIGNRSKVLWDKRTNLEYEFNDNLKIIRMGKEKTNRKSKTTYMILDEKERCRLICDDYGETIEEAKMIALNNAINCTIYKSIAYIEVGTPKLTEF